MFNAGLFEYKAHVNKDCLVNNDIYSMSSDGTSDHTNCVDWCNNNNICRGFTTYSNTCFFKSQECGTFIENADNVVLYIKQGSDIS